MALVVEDGSGLANAMSFVSRADYIAFALARGVVIADDAAADVELVKAMDFLKSRCYRGDPTLMTQALPFPRHAEQFDGTLTFPDDEVPKPMIEAQMHLALAVHAGVDLMPNVATGQASVKREKIGPIETEYDQSSVFDLPSLPAAATAIAPYECGQGGRFRTLRV